MTIDAILSPSEYGLVRMFRALANENRFIAFNNLRLKTTCYEAELSEALKISRPALSKHVRILMRERLVEQEHIVESGTVKARYKLTEYGEQIAKKVIDFEQDIKTIVNEVTKAFQAELMDITLQIESITRTLSDLKTRFSTRKITSTHYENIKADYETKLKSLRRRRRELKKNGI